jgi:hypothetical protein
MTTTTKKSDVPQAQNAHTDKTSTEKEEPLITLDQLARELIIPARDARMVLRLAAKQTKQYPHLGKEHVARQPWAWAPGSQALEEARNALSASRED